MSAITADDMRATINEWADKRGFRPEIPYAESTLSLIHIDTADDKESEDLGHLRKI